jgi:hypothetical protein
MWEKGHSFEEIDNMSLGDWADVLAYWAETNKIREKQSKTNKNLQGAK